MASYEKGPVLFTEKFDFWFNEKLHLDVSPPFPLSLSPTILCQQIVAIVWLPVPLYIMYASMAS